MIRFISSSNPTSSIRSASSIIRAFKFLKTKSFVFWGVLVRLRIFHDRTKAYFEMIKKTTWSRHQKVHTLGKLVHLRSPVCTAHNDAKGLGVVGHEFLRDTKDLQCELSCWGDDNNPSA
jgi:hypothetical protein